MDRPDSSLSWSLLGCGIHARSRGSCIHPLSPSIEGVEEGPYSACFPGEEPGLREERSLGKAAQPGSNPVEPTPCHGVGVGSLQVRAGARAFLLMWTREGRGKPVGGLSAWSGGSGGRKPAFGLNPGSPYPCEFPSPFCWLHSVSQGGAGELRAGRRLRLVLAPAPPALVTRGKSESLICSLVNGGWSRSCLENSALGPEHVPPPLSLCPS